MNEPPSKTAAYSRHFYSLDVLRGVAALSIVVCHWQHFFFVGTHEGNVDLNRLPLYGLFKPLYAEGWRAVDLFFCLSGFIFYWLYSEKIAMGKTSLKEFAVLRFSRLYPLHFLTLLLVTLGQLIMLHFYGSYFVYTNNDLYHFALQLFFISNWGFERGLSFNGPIWSVSLEAFLYAIFFVVCIFRFDRWWHLPILIWLGHFLLKYGHGELSQGMVSFFSGGLSYYLFLFFWRRGITTFTVMSLILLTLALWIIIPLTDDRSALTALDASGNTGEDLVVHHANLLGRILFRLHENAYEMILFPSTILTLSTCEAFRGTLGKRLSLLGDISYSCIWRIFHCNCYSCSSPAFFLFHMPSFYHLGRCYFSLPFSSYFRYTAMSSLKGRCKGCYGPGYFSFKLCLARARRFAIPFSCQLEIAVRSRLRLVNKGD